MAQMLPLRNAAQARCHGRAQPRASKAQMLPAAAALNAMPQNKICLRLQASHKRPEMAPKQSSGKLRAASTRATSTPEPVIRNVNKRAASISVQRIALAMPPSNPSRLKAGKSKTPAMGPCRVNDSFIPSGSLHAKASLTSEDVAPPACGSETGSSASCRDGSSGHKP